MIVPSNTHIATALAVTYVGTKPIFVESDIRTYNIRYAISDGTKANIPVHLYGQPCDIDAILDIADENGLYIVEDCAQVHGALYKGKKVGLLVMYWVSVFIQKRILGHLEMLGQW